MNLKIIEIQFVEGKYKEIRFITDLFAFKLTDKGRCIYPIKYDFKIISLENYKEIYNEMGIKTNELL